MNDENGTLTRGIHHLGLSVRDLPKTVAFFCECLGWTVVAERPDYPAVFVSDKSIMLTLWQVASPDDCIAFDRRENVGLHHVALAVGTRQELDELHKKVAAWKDVVVEFAPEQSGQGPNIHFMIREPSGIRIEFTYDPRRPTT